MGTDKNRSPKKQPEALRASERPTLLFGSGKTSSERGKFAHVELLGEVIDMILEGGCALLLGRTRDGGATAVTLLNGEDRTRGYCVDQAELDQVFRDIAEMLEVNLP